LVLLHIEVAESRSSTGWRWRGACHTHVWHCGLVAAVSAGSTHTTSHRYSKLLLLCHLLLLELELVGVGREVEVLHLALQLLELVGQLLLLWDDAHVDVLLVGGGDLLLLLLKHFDLLGEGELLHCGRHSGKQVRALQQSYA
jgi:hypothetical protein